MSVDGLDNLVWKENCLTLYDFQDPKESEKHWAKIHELKTIKYFYFTNSNFKVDYEENIPKLIQNNPKFKGFSITFSQNFIDFDNQNLKQSLQNKKLKSFTLYGGDERNTPTCLNMNDIFKCLEESKIETFEANRVSFTTSTMKSIQKIQDLRKIDLFNCEFLDEISQDISIPVTHLSIVDVKFSKEDVMYQFIQCFPNLKHIQLYSGLIIDCLKLKKSLSGVCLDEYYGDNSFTNVEFLKDILQNIQKEIYIHENKKFINVDFPFFSYLKDNQNLRKFISYFGIHNFKDLDTFLLNNQEIQEFDLLLKPKSKILNQVDQIKILAKGLSQNHSIKTFFFKINLKDELEYLIKGLMENTTITDLRLPDSSLDDKSSHIIGDYLSKNKTLKSLSITYNDFTEKCLIPICNGLTQNQSLESLSLSLKSLTNKGCESLKELFSLNQTLRSIQISDSLKFNEDVLKTLGEILSRNSSLQKFSLTCKTKFSLDSVLEFRNNLFFNTNLVLFKLNSQASEYISPILQRNSSFINTLKIDQTKFNDLKVNFN